MSQGEIDQLLHRQDLSTDEEQYMEVIKRKTAYLIQAACQTGALLARASEDQVDALVHYGYHLGVAFQLVDDLLDYTAEAQVLGKATGTDLTEGKLTLPVIYALKRSTVEDRKRMETIIQQGTFTKGEFDSTLRLVAKYGGIEYTRKRAQEHIDQAQKYLQIFDVSKTRRLLEDLADYVVVRKM
jgi:octaprenyl-diphosphate synthase